MAVELEQGKKFVNATWKEGNPWYLTRDMRDGERCEKYVFEEISNYGILQGKVFFTEHPKENLDGKSL